MIFNKSVLPIHETLVSTTTLGLSGPGSNGNEGILHTVLTSRTGTSPPGIV